MLHKYKSWLWNLDVYLIKKAIWTDQFWQKLYSSKLRIRRIICNCRGSPAEGYWHSNGAIWTKSFRKRWHRLSLRHELCSLSNGCTGRYRDRNRLPGLRVGTSGRGSRAKFIPGSGAHGIAIQSVPELPLSATGWTRHAVTIQLFSSCCLRKLSWTIRLPEIRAYVYSYTPVFVQFKSKWLQTQWRWKTKT